jgi:hypothetical protein
MQSNEETVIGWHGLDLLLHQSGTKRKAVKQSPKAKHLRSTHLNPCRLDAVDEVESEYLTDAEMRRRERKNFFIVLRKTAWRIKGVDGLYRLITRRIM